MMDDSRHALPPALAAKIFRDLRPVRPVLRSDVRAMAIGAVALLAAVLLLAVSDVRSDFATLPSIAFFGMLTARIAAGLLLVSCALKESVPSAASSAPARALAIGSGLAVLFILPGIFAQILGGSSAGNPLGGWACFGFVLAVAIPSFIGLVVLMTRAYPLRPLLAGLLAGLGSGALAEAAQFVGCSDTHPLHGWVVHGGAALTVALCGVMAGLLIHLSRRRDFSF